MLPADDGLMAARLNELMVPDWDWAACLDIPLEEACAQ